MGELPDWRRATNIATDPELYERENDAVAADGRLDRALREVADWAGRTLLDVGCGTGYWLPRYAVDADRVIGVEPDPDLLARAHRRTRHLDNVEVVRGSAEHLPVAPATVDVAHARFAYFFGEGAEAGLHEVGRVLRPGGVFVAVDNDWGYGRFADLLRRADVGNAAIDPETTDRWWRDRSAIRIDVPGAWRCRSAEELEAILRLELPGPVVDAFVAAHPGTRELSYGFALFVVRAPFEPAG